jgi:hypothetical protein
MASQTSPTNGRGRSFTKGKSGNPTGRPRGARNRTTVAAEAFLEGEDEALTRKAVELALSGDLTALRICLDRLLPPRRERLLSFELPPLNSAEDSMKAMAAITAAVAGGEVTLSEAAELAKLVEGFIHAVEAHDFEQRLGMLEAERSRLLLEGARRHDEINATSLTEDRDMPFS